MPYNTGAIVDKGGNLKCLIQFTDAFALYTPTSLNTTGINLGHWASSDTEQTADVTEYKSEDGKVRQTDETYNLNTNGILMQTDAQIINFLANTVKGKIFLEYNYRPDVDGKQWELFKFVKVAPQFKVSSPGGSSSMPYKSTGIFPDSNVTITTTVIASIETLLSISIAASADVSVTAAQGFAIVET